MKQNLIRAVELIGRAMHPEHLQANHSFNQRSDLINHMLVSALQNLTFGSQVFRVCNCSVLVDCL